MTEPFPDRMWHKKATLRISVPVVMTEDEIERLFPEGTWIQIGSQRYQIYSAYMVETEPPYLKLNCGREEPPPLLQLENDFQVVPEDT